MRLGPNAFLVIALLLWRLIEFNMRNHLEKQEMTIPGWDNKPTERPTTFMMTTKFDDIRIIKIRRERTLNGRLSKVQEKYLLVLGLTAPFSLNQFALIHRKDIHDTLQRHDRWLNSYLPHS